MITGVGDHKHNDKKLGDFNVLNTEICLLYRETKERRGGRAGEEEGPVYRRQCQNSKPGFLELHTSAKVKKATKILNNLFLWVFLVYFK